MVKQSILEKAQSLNISYVHRRIGHHASHSGYNAVFEHMQLPVATSGFMRTVVKLLPASVKWRLSMLRPQQVGDAGLIPELLALSQARSAKPGICHFIYGEDTYFYTPLWQHKNKKIVATYHYPPQRLEERVAKQVLNRLSGVILMSNSQRAFFERYLPADRIHVVHHHVNTDFFCPGTGKTDGQVKRIMSLGGILRDMSLLEEVVERLTNRLGEENIKFDFLIPKQERERFRRFNNVTLHSRVSDEELRDLYRNATIGFLPLQDCTANNAALEMMACGKAIACSNVGGISDYLDENGALMFDIDMDRNALVDKLIDLLESDQTREKMGYYNRQKALDVFSFDATAEKLMRVYEKLHLQHD